MKTFFLFLLFLSSSAHSFTLNSDSNPNFKGWPSGDINFAINATNCPANVQGLIESALDAWRNVSSTNVNVNVTGTTTSTTYSNPTTIYCEVNFGAVTGSDENSVPGVAGLIPAGGEYATGGVLVLNVSTGTANISTYNANIVKIVLAHEIGHILGLGHSHDTNALMYFDASAKNTLRLAQDDVDGLTYLYPRDELDGDQLLGGCGSVRAPKPPTNVGLVLLLLMLPFAAALSLRLRLKLSQ